MLRPSSWSSASSPSNVACRCCLFWLQRYVSSRKHPPVLGGGGPPFESGGCAGAAWIAEARSRATIAPNKSGESGEPCRMPFVCGTVVRTSPTAMLSARVSSTLNHRFASHGCSPPLAGTGHLSDGTPPTRAATSSPILCCQTLSNAFRMSSFTSQVGTPQSRAICVTRRIVATSSTPCLPARAH